MLVIFVAHEGAHIIECVYLFSLTEKLFRNLRPTKALFNKVGEYGGRG